MIRTEYLLSILHCFFLIIKQINPSRRNQMTERSPHPDRLPNCENAEIPQDKLERYCLNPDHVSTPYGRSSGRDKARVFKAALGFDQSTWEVLRDRILSELPYHEASLGAADEFGQRYTVTLPITGVNGNTANVLVAWIVRLGTDYPSLVSTYVT